MFGFLQRVILVLLLFSTFLVSGEDFIVERDYSHALTFFDNSEKTFLPTELSNREHRLLYLFLNADDVRERRLRFVVHKPLVLFLNEKLVQEFTKSITVNLDLDSLLEDSETRCDLAFYASEKVNAFDGPLLVKSIDQQNFSKESVKVGSGISYWRSDNSIYYFLLLAACLLLAYFKFVKSPYLSAYYDVTSYFSRFSVDDYVIINTFTSQALVLWGISSLLITLGFGFSHISIFEIQNLLGACIGVGLVFGLFFLKYFYLAVLNVLYGGSGQVKIHFFESIRFVSISGLMVGLLILVGLDNYRIALLIVLPLLFSVFLIALIRALQYKRMYLISYLCISEILPFIFLLKLIVG